jgi:hypothetical protein
MLRVQIRYVLHNLFAIKQAVEEANEQILVHCCSKNSLETEVGQQADVSFFYLFHTLYVFIFFCKDTLNICNFQIFRAVFYIEEWKVFLLIPSPPFTTLHP